MDILFSVIFLILAFSASTALIYLSQKIKSKSIKIIAVILALGIPIIISGIRHNVGIDYPEYEKIFNNIIAGRPAWDHLLEPTFYIFSWISNFMTGNSVLLYTIYAGIFIGFSYLFMKKVLPKAYLPMAFFAMLMMTFPMSMNIVRQSAAVAVCVFAVWFIIDKQPPKYILSIVLASTLHFSAIILLPLYLINLLFRKTNTNLYKIYILIGIIAILCIIAPFILKLLTYIPIINHYLYLAHIDQSFYLSSRLLANLFIIVIVWAFAKDSIVNDRYKLMIMVTFAIGVCLQMIGFFMRSASRISLYLTSLLPIVLIYLSSAKCKKYPKLLSKIMCYKYFWQIIIVIISIAYFLGICLFDNSGYNILPYQTVFYLN